MQFVLKVRVSANSQMLTTASTNVLRWEQCYLWLDCSLFAVNSLFIPLHVYVPETHVECSMQNEQVRTHDILQQNVSKRSDREWIDSWIVYMHSFVDSWSICGVNLTEFSLGGILILLIFTRLYKYSLSSSCVV